MDYKTLYPWAPSNLISETSSYTSHEKIAALRKKKCHFGREDNWIFLNLAHPTNLYVAMRPYPRATHFAISMLPFFKESTSVSPCPFLKKNS